MEEEPFQSGVEIGVVIGLGIACVEVGRITQRRAQRSLESAAFVAELSALQDLRRGDVSNGIMRIEKHCYAVALGLWEHGSPVTRVFGSELTDYRRTYAPNSSTWTYAERKLEELISTRAMGSGNQLP